MFGMGWPEMAVIGIVGILVFGPDKLPEFARQAAQFTRNLRRMAQDAKDDLTREFGSELNFAETRRDLAETRRELDPRDIVRRTMLEGNSAPAPAQRELQPGERPPLDPDAT
jgi:sec-independent protein translocase protein TatB